MSKFAVRGLTETLQSELAGSNVRLLSVHPGGVKTKLIQNAPDLHSAQEKEFAHTAFSRWAFLTPEHVASRILRAIKRGRRRLILGIDAHLVHAICRLFPNRFPAILAPIFRQMDFKQPAGGSKDR